MATINISVGRYVFSFAFCFLILVGVRSGVSSLDPFVDKNILYNVPFEKIKIKIKLQEGVGENTFFSMFQFFNFANARGFGVSYCLSVSALGSGCLRFRCVTPLFQFEQSSPLIRQKPFIGQIIIFRDG